jgi:hypothetical protein
MTEQTRKWVCKCGTKNITLNCKCGLRIELQGGGWRYVNLDPGAQTVTKPPPLELTGTVPLEDQFAPDELTSLRAEIERQQADIDKLLAERQEWLNEIERLTAALREYGQHKGTCNDHGGRDCNCGWERTRTALEHKP